MNKAIGGVELSSVARGYFTADAMIKAADVCLLLSRTICSGKYLIVVSGEVAAVAASVETAEKISPTALVDSFLIASIHPEVIDAVNRTRVVEKTAALGIVEGFSVSGLIEAADAAVKSADVELVEIRLAMALGGKAFVILTGSVAAVENAVGAGSAVLSAKGLLADRAVIPQPRKELTRELI